MLLKEADWEGWWFHPCTQQFLMDLTRTRGELLEAWAGGTYCGEGVTLELNAKAIGEAGMLQQMIDLINDCRPKEKEDEQQGN